MADQFNSAVSNRRTNPREYLIDTLRNMGAPRTTAEGAGELFGYTPMSEAYNLGDAISRRDVGGAALSGASLLPLGAISRKGSRALFGDMGDRAREDIKRQALIGKMQQEGREAQRKATTDSKIQLDRDDRIVQGSLDPENYERSIEQARDEFFNNTELFDTMAQLPEGEWQPVYASLEDFLNLYRRSPKDMNEMMTFFHNTVPPRR